MLQTRSVYPDTLGLLKELMKEPLLDNHFMDWYKTMFKHDTTFHVIRSLVYFEDAEKTENPIVFDTSVTWTKVKKRLVEVVKTHF